MQKLCLFLLSIMVLSCNENLVEKPDNLIPEDKMVVVLMDLAIVNAAKSTDISVLHDNDIEPMAYVFKKHDIDSLQFVESDNYYASLPKGAYERIYKEVTSKLEKKSKSIEKAREVKDSLARMERESMNNESETDSVTDILP